MNLQLLGPGLSVLGLGRLERLLGASVARGNGVGGVSFVIGGGGRAEAAWDDDERHRPGL